MIVEKSLGRVEFIEPIYSYAQGIFHFGMNNTIEWYNDHAKELVFIVLISKSSLKSKPVKEEIDHAHYGYINRDRPARLVPALVEAGVAPPTTIEQDSSKHQTQNRCSSARCEHTHFGGCQQAGVPECELGDKQRHGETNAGC